MMNPELNHSFLKSEIKTTDFSFLIKFLSVFAAKTLLCSLEFLKLSVYTY